MVVGILGCGAMGTGIAQVAAMAGCEVQLVDISDAARSRSRAGLEKILLRQVEKGRMAHDEVKAILGRIYYSDDLKRFAPCDLVIEAIVENLDIKVNQFTAIEATVSESCILASNTSSLSITTIAAQLKLPQRMLGLHFFNPAPIMKLVEVIPAIQTGDAITTQANKIIEGWGKYTVLAKDTPGFIVNKVARPFYSEALRILEEGLADVETIDDVMVQDAGFRMGPFTLMDYIGHDVNYKVTASVWQAFYYDDRYKPSFAQKSLVDAGYLGRKSGKGFFDYSDGATPTPPSTDPDLRARIMHRVLAMLVNEAADTVYMGICSATDVEVAMTKGVNYPKGLLTWGEEIGYDKIVAILDGLYEYYHDNRYRVSPWLRLKV